MIKINIKIIVKMFEHELKLIHQLKSGYALMWYKTGLISVFR